MSLPSEPLSSPVVLAAPPAPVPAMLVPSSGALAPSGEFTLRAMVGGCIIGSLLAVTNVYMGLKTGWWESGSIVAAVLGFSGLSALGRRGGAASTPLEVNLTQTAACAVGAMPAAIGLLGSLPALQMMDISVPSWGVIAFGTALGVLGVLAAYLLRRRLIVEEGLAFPTGVATAEVITAMHKTGRVERPGRAQVLLGSGLVSMGVTWLRDVHAWIPTMSALPFRLAGMPASTFTWGIGWTPMLLAVGMMSGLSMGLSMLLGAVLAWAVTAPALVQGGVIAGDAGYEVFAAWLTWPGVGLMVGAAMASLVLQARSLLGAVRDLRGLGSVGDGAGRWVAGPGLVACALTLVLGSGVFGLPMLHTLLALALVLPLCAVCGRGAGQTDISPVSQMGQLTQVASGTLFPGPAALNVAAGSVVAGAVAQTGVSLWSLKAGQLLGASAPRQLKAQLLGVLVGALVSVPAYLLLVGAYGLGSEALPVPSAHQFRAVAELATQGVSGLPPYAAEAAGLGFSLGVVLTLATRGKLERYMPSAVAMGIGFIMPAHGAVAIAASALLTELVRRVRPSWVEKHAMAVGAGAIAGESVMGMAIGGLVALGFIQRVG
ncbi:OPT family oligopeptide transporter [Hyalangium rubrum]|uniref:OPT family oligopeptide transporter n=1 Tax=Hyalangium rubrum TaxID=3103134 RepID=A0ABU5HI03_9BACT|nr:OPT family oligopeptide transporter [Hyalangium sp. s54d21]MDY7232777.1 OPT family oligopeptide transporter [Hyalangium sp. s54d21]